MNDKELTDYIQGVKDFGLKNDIPNVSVKNAHFLQDIVSIWNYKNVLEIGTASGYSTLSLWQTLQKTNGHITSIDFSEASYNLAQSHIEASWLTDTITLIHANALELLPNLTESYDFIFIDGMKRRSKDFLRLCLPILKKPGLIIIDDVIKYKEKMQGLEKYVKELKLRYNILPIDEDDGVMMIYINAD